MVQSLNLEKSKPVTTPGEDQKKEKEEEEESVLLDVARASGYRQIAARANCMAQDRADTQIAVKEVCRGMANPNCGPLETVEETRPICTWEASGSDEVSFAESSLPGRWLFRQRLGRLPAHSAVEPVCLGIIY